jgi:alkylated DNA repair dioxygenase AlkB
MSQPSLFDTTDAFVVDDGKGRVSYAPRFVNARTAAAWFAELRSGVEWRAERRMMYDREVDVPRLVGHFRLDPPPASMPDAILEAARLVTNRLDAPFNAVGLNLYRDGRDSVAPHNDHLNELRKGFPIALVSLGTTRRMTIRPKAQPRKPVYIDLEPGSLLVMDYDTQLHYTHGVPKTEEPVGERISLAFRVRPNVENRHRAVYGG